MFALPTLPDSSTGSLLIAFSGGLDSTVLLHRLAQDSATRTRGLRALHVHHGLHADADAWAAHCQRVCDQWQVPLTIARVQVDRQSGLGLEAAARSLRYAALAQHLDDNGVLVTAHHRDDQAETFLLRALRASGTDGLAAMALWRRFHSGWHWRPLLDTAREALLTYAREHGLSWIEDSSNTDTDLDRNFLRHRVLPLLRQRWPQADAAFARSAALAADSTRLLAEEDARALAMARTLDPQALSVPALLALPRERRARVLRRWLEQLGMPPLPGEGVQRIEHDLLPAQDDAQAQFHWQGAVLRRWRDLLHVETQAPALPDDWQAQWDTAQALQLPGGDPLWLASPQPWPTPIRLSARLGGERMRLPGRSHSHALKKLLQASGIPPWERRRLPLLWDADGELLAAGDLLLSARMDHWLRARGAALYWRRTHEHAAHGNDALT